MIYFPAQLYYYFGLKSRNLTPWFQNFGDGGEKVTRVVSPSIPKYFTMRIAC